jgi:Putative capsular polysaccharide synthesis protein
MSLTYKIRRAIHNYYRLYIKRETPIAIFCTGRVGSMALFFTLKAADIFTFKIEQLHNAAMRQQYGNSEWFYRHILKSARPAKIISIARDPIALMVSDFFNKLAWIAEQERAWETLSLAELIDLFNTRYFEQNRHWTHLNWFEEEFETSLGVNVFAYPSPREQGFQGFTVAPYDILLLRTETDNIVKSQAVAEFVDRPNLTIQRSNVGDEKEFGDVYQAFKKALIVAPQHLDTVYKSPYATHFYTTDELAKMRQKWSMAQ